MSLLTNVKLHPLNPHYPIPQIPRLQKVLAHSPLPQNHLKKLHFTHLHLLPLIRPLAMSLQTSHPHRYPLFPSPPNSPRSQIQSFSPLLRKLPLGLRLKQQSPPLQPLRQSHHQQKTKTMSKSSLMLYIT
jgi:hypothetical protein